MRLIWASAGAVAALSLLDCTVSPSLTSGSGHKDSGTDATAGAGAGGADASTTGGSDAGGASGASGASDEGGPCSSPRVDCNGQCVNLQSDNANCGKCGNACAAGLSCQNDQCTCPSGQQCGSGLLSGCTVEANNQPSCALPSGWTLVTAQGFESGSLAAGQSFCSLTSIESGSAHTGTHAAGGRYTGGDQQDCWVLSGNQIDSTTTYVSFWEYDDSSLHTNEEMFLGRRTLSGTSGSFVADIVWDVGAPGSGGCLWNCADASGSYMTSVEGNGAQGPNFALYGPSTTFGLGVWTQWEIYMSTGATNAGTNGEVKVWRDGTLLADQGGKNFVGSYDYSQASLQVGGVYTYLTWWMDSAHTQCPSPPAHSNYTTNYGDWSKADPCPGQAPPGGYGFPFSRYFDDIIVLKQ